MALKAFFSPEDWETLLFGPFWVLDVASKADGVTDIGEKKKFFQEVKNLCRIRTNELTREVFSEINKNIEEISSGISRDKRDPAFAMLDMKKILESSPAEVKSTGFCEELFSLGVKIADTSGEISNSGRRISQAELRILAGIAILLDIDLEKMEPRHKKISVQIHGFLKRIEKGV